MRHLKIDPELGPLTDTLLEVTAPFTGEVVATAQTLDLEGLGRALARAEALH